MNHFLSMNHTDLSIPNQISPPLQRIVAQYYLKFLYPPDMIHVCLQRTIVFPTCNN
jgi:hypothetical protein